MNKQKYTCPCCGYKTLSEPPPGTYYICEICGWEDDNVQFDDPDFEGGANEMSLRQAQKNFAEFGAKGRDHIDHVRGVRKENFERDLGWRPLKRPAPGPMS